MTLLVHSLAPLVGLLALVFSAHSHALYPSPLFLRQGSTSGHTPKVFINSGTNNGTNVGTYSCALHPGPSASHLSYSPDSVPGTSCPDAEPPVYPYNPIHLRAPDDSIRATFLPYAATVSELWVKDRYGGWRDVVLGE